MVTNSCGMITNSLGMVTSRPGMATDNKRHDGNVLLHNKDIIKIVAIVLNTLKSGMRSMLQDQDVL